MYLGVVFEATSGFTSSQIPQAKGLVPGTRQSVVTIGRKDNITDEVGVSVKTFVWESVVVFIAGQLPDDQSLVCKTICSNKYQCFIEIKENLPLEAEMMLSGSFGLVAIWVTHPLCPKRVPRNCNVSVAIFLIFQSEKNASTPHENVRKKKEKAISYPE